MEREEARIQTDICLFSERKDGLYVLLIKRGAEPFKGSWCFPGGHVDKGERFDEAAPRELEEETGIAGIQLNRVDVFDQPDRDPRGRAISVLYSALVGNLEAKGGDDAAEARWWLLEELPDMAFDHPEMLERALAWLKDPRHQEGH